MANVVETVANDAAIISFMYVDALHGPSVTAVPQREAIDRDVVCNYDNDCAAIATINKRGIGTFANERYCLVDHYMLEIYPRRDSNHVALLRIIYRALNGHEIHTMRSPKTVTNSEEKGEGSYYN